MGFAQFVQLILIVDGGLSMNSNNDFRTRSACSSMRDRMMKKDIKIIELSCN